MAHSIALDHRLLWTPESATRVRARSASHVSAIPALVAFAIMAVLVSGDARVEPLHTYVPPSELAVTPTHLAQNTLP